MDTNINTIDSSYTSDVVTYDDSQIDTIINELNEIVNLLSSIDTEISGLDSNDTEWKGESKNQYLDLKLFLKSYHSDYGKSIEELRKVVSGLKTLLGSISTSNVIKEKPYTNYIYLMITQMIWHSSHFQQLLKGMKIEKTTFCGSLRKVLKI